MCGARACKTDRWRFCVCATGCRAAATAWISVSVRGSPIVDPDGIVEDSRGRQQAEISRFQTGCARWLMGGNCNRCWITAPGWHKCCLDKRRTFETHCREATMDQVIQDMHAVNSPQEWALHFLLRHAQCRTTLMAGKDACAQAEPLTALAVPAGQCAEASATDGLGDRFAAQDESDAPCASGDSCAARFSRAFVAARHS